MPACGLPVAVVGVEVQVRCITVQRESVSARDVPSPSPSLPLFPFPRSCLSLESSSPSCFPPFFLAPFVFSSSALHSACLCYVFPPYLVMLFFCLLLSVPSFRNAHTLACIFLYCIYAYAFGGIHTYMHYLSPAHEGNLALSSSLCCS